jgi:LuxR family maltose regulon positive regulatory protein
MGCWTSIPQRPRAVKDSRREWPWRSQAAQPLVEPLTPRELEVLQLIAGGLTNQQITDELVLSLGTVKWHTSQIYGKLAVSSRTQAIARALDLLT